MLNCGRFKVTFLNNYRWQFGERERPKDRLKGCRIVWTHNWQGNQQREGERVSSILTGFRLKWLITSKASGGLATSSGCCCVVCCRGPGPEAWGDAVTVASFANHSTKSVFICFFSSLLSLFLHCAIFYSYNSMVSKLSSIGSAPSGIGKHQYGDYCIRSTDSHFRQGTCSFSSFSFSFVQFKKLHPSFFTTDLHNVGGGGNVISSNFLQWKM